MYNPATRLLSILELLQSRGEVSGAQLAQALEVEERSVRRYISMLRDMGIPVEGERGRHGGYTLRPGFRLPPLMFNADEITAVGLGLSLMGDLDLAHRHAVESATAKITRVLPDELRRSVEAMRSSLTFADIQTEHYGVPPARVAAFGLAAYEGKCLHITYLSNEGTESQRQIAPYGLVLHAGVWYVPAYCHLREGMRVFRLDRVRDYKASEETFVRPIDFDPTQFILDALAVMPRSTCYEVLWYAPLGTVQALIPSSMATLEAVGENTLMRCYSDDAHWLARQIARIELPFTVVETEALRAALRALAQTLLAGAHG